MASPTRTSSEELLKDGLAGRFLAEIVNGSLSPGERRLIVGDVTDEIKGIQVPANFISQRIEQ